MNHQTKWSICVLDPIFDHISINIVFTKRETGDQSGHCYTNKKSIQKSNHQTRF